MSWEGAVHWVQLNPGGGLFPDFVYGCAISGFRTPPFYNHVRVGFINFVLMRVGALRHASSVQMYMFFACVDPKHHPPSPGGQNRQVGLTIFFRRAGYRGH